jgi:hypothetical protein
VLAYQQLGLIPKLKETRASLGAEGFRHIARMKVRVELPPSRGQCVVQFADDKDPRSVRVVMTYSKTKPVEVALKWFAQPTNERVTTGILGHLPWLPSIPDLGLLVGAVGQVPHREHREADTVAATNFLTERMQEELIDAARRRKRSAN